MMACWLGECALLECRAIRRNCVVMTGRSGFGRHTLKLLLGEPLFGADPALGRARSTGQPAIIWLIGHGHTVRLSRQ
jgi:hypothetical protein